MPETAEKSIALPPLLEAGDTFGIIAPSGYWREDEFQQGINLLKDRGFQVKLPDPLPEKKGYLAGSDRQRLQTLEQILKAPEVKAVIPVRGGYGCLRILDFIDYNFIKANPKIFVGFSDVSSLIQAISKKCNLVTLHGPMLTTLNKCDKFSLEFFFDSLTGRSSPRIRPNDLKILKNGNASGPLTGGNLTTLVHLLATDYETSWQGKIVFLEDIGESPYRIDRLFTHLYMAGRFRGIAGLILGEFTNCGNEEKIRERILELFQLENFPIWARFPVGHSRRNLTLPLGIPARMDSESGELSINLPVHHRY